MVTKHCSKHIARNIIGRTRKKITSILFNRIIRKDLNLFFLYIFAVSKSNKTLPYCSKLCKEM